MPFVFNSTTVSEVRFETFPHILERDFWTFIVVFSKQFCFVNGVIGFFCVFFYVLVLKRQTKFLLYLYKLSIE